MEAFEAESWHGGRAEAGSGHGEERGVVVAVDDGLAVGLSLEMFAESVARSHEERQMGKLVLRERALFFRDAATRDDGEIAVIGERREHEIAKPCFIAERDVDLASEQPFGEDVRADEDAVSDARVRGLIALQKTRQAGVRDARECTDGNRGFLPALEVSGFFLHAHERGVGREQGGQQGASFVCQRDARMRAREQRTAELVLEAAHRLRNSGLRRVELGRVLAEAPEPHGGEQRAEADVIHRRSFFSSSFVIPLFYLRSSALSSIVV